MFQRPDCSNHNVQSSSLIEFHGVHRQVINALTAVPVKSQFGYHIIKVVDVRDAQLPPLDEVKPQIQQRLMQIKMAQFRDEIRAKTKTDYKFSN